MALDLFGLLARSLHRALPAGGQYRARVTQVQTSGVERLAVGLQWHSRQIRRSIIACEPSGHLRMLAGLQNGVSVGGHRMSHVPGGEYMFCSGYAQLGRHRDPPHRVGCGRSLPGDLRGQRARAHSRGPDQRLAGDAFSSGERHTHFISIHSRNRRACANLGSGCFQRVADGGSRTIP